MLVHGISPTPLQLQPSFLQKTKTQIVQNWKIIKSHLRFEAITFLFFRAIGLFSPKLAARCELAWKRTETIFLRWSAARRETRLQKEISQLMEINKKLQARMGIDHSSPRMSQVIYEKNQALQQIQDFIKEREALTLKPIQISVERDLLATENKQLKEANYNLKIEKDQLIQDKNALQAKCQHILEELKVFEIKFENNEHYQLLNQHLAQFQALYQQLPKTPAYQQGMTQLAVDTLIPLYQKHKEEILLDLKEIIEKLPQTDLVLTNPILFQLKCLLRLLEEEKIQLEEIAKILLLMEELRMSFSEYLKKIQALCYQSV